MAFKTIFKYLNSICYYFSHNFKHLNILALSYMLNKLCSALFRSSAFCSTWLANHVAWWVPDVNVATLTH